ncbi:PREDICTED: uncharacterized protein LOC109183381 [Ipomoea nil]|uniref:uncharacterized protein LOC109183381 n=1 Tax=Ipomoea nil TaxID=35883 RepID=UPI000900F3E7|nr:PREDICTED: uncharacterized protein LOC109183381 [Ipomoea nil]
MVRTRNQRMGKLPRRGTTNSTSKHTGTGESSNPVCVEEENSANIVMDPVPIARVPFGKPQEQSTNPPGNSNLPLIDHEETPIPMPIAADFRDNRIVVLNDIVVQLRFSINQGWEPDMGSYVSSEQEDNPRESEVEGHTDPHNHEEVHPSSPNIDEQTVIEETPNPIPQVSKNPRKRKMPDPYEGADPRAKRPKDEQNWVPNDEIEPSGCEKIRTRAQKKTNLERKQPQITKVSIKAKGKQKATAKEKGKQKVVSTDDDLSNLPNPHSTTFLSKESGKLWNRIVEKRIINQKILDTNKLDNSEQIQEALITNQLLGTVTNIEPYDEEVIQEFYCNLTKSTTIPSSPMYGKIYVRGKLYEFTPDTINNYLGTSEIEQEIELNSEQVAKELTAGNVSFEKNKIKAASLTSKYAILQKIALANWMPSLHESTGLKTQGSKTTVKNFNTTVKLRKGNHQNDLKSTAPNNNPLDSKTLITYFKGRLTELEASEKQLLRRHMIIKEEKAEIIEWLAVLKAEIEDNQEQGTEEDIQEHSEESENEDNQSQNQGSEEDIQERGAETPVSTPEPGERE